MEKITQILIFSPKPNATPDEIMEILKFLFFQTYPPELRTRENMLGVYNQLSEGAKRHFKVQ
jgi:hypothetical protein